MKFFVFMEVILFSFLAIALKGQDNGVRTIYLMRIKNIYGSGNKMNIMVNGNLVYKLKNGERLIMHTQSKDTIRIQCIYPLMKKYKSDVLKLYPDGEKEIYVDASYIVENFPQYLYSSNQFNFKVGLEILPEELGKVKINHPDLYRDNFDNIKLIKFLK